jgi:Mg/Co/Ni transporter MgtE
MSDIENALRNAAERAILKIISEGAWIQPDYHNRVQLPADFMADVWKLVDREKVKKALAERIEEQLAERMINAMAAELATDIKQILSVAERREALRSLAREHMEAIMARG